MRLIQLLEQKNHYLEKFFSLNDLQARLLVDNEIDTLDEFYHQREKLLDIISYIDEQITEAYSQFDGKQMATEVQRLLFIKDEYVHRILDQEVTILSLMDQLKSGILSELIEIKANQKAIKGYRSPILETKLSEKA